MRCTHCNATIRLGLNIGYRVESDLCDQCYADIKAAIGAVLTCLLMLRQANPIRYEQEMRQAGGDP